MVDDNPRFLMHLSARLDSALHFKLLSDPRDALPLVDEKALLIQVTSSALVVDEDLEIDRKDLSIFQSYQGVRLTNFLDLVENENRFNEISVIVVDYAMPGMNGIDLCRALSKHPAKKILLTGEADHRIAVDAFNEGLIHRFILKQTQEDLLCKELNLAIDEMQNIYFSTNSRKILANLALDETFTNPFLIKFFNQIFSQKKYMEFYLLNARGSLLLLDENGEAEIFVCENAKTLDSYALMAKDNEGSNALINALAAHTHLPYLLIAKDEDLPFDQWENHLLPATQIPSTDLFYALVPGSLGLPHYFLGKKVMKYADFIEEHLKTESDI
jgi:CheY-like chemotaxis protein